MKPRIKYFFIYFLLLLLLLSPSLVAYVIEKLPSRFILCILIQGGLLLLPFGIFHKNLRLYLYLLIGWILLAPFALISPVFFGIEMNTDFLILVINTTFREAIELFGKLIIPFILFFIVYVGLYIFLVKKSVKKISRKTGIFISILGIVMFMTGIISGTGFQNLAVNTKAGLVSYYPTDILYSALKYSEKIKRVDHEALIKNYTFQAKKEDTLKDREIYVLVIGETARYQNWGLNGYKRNTSPLLEKRKNLLSFSDVSTVGCMTELSVPLIITRAKPYDFEQHYSEKGISGAFAESGFQTYWISNQEDYFNIRMHVNELKNVINLAPSRSSSQSVYDIKVVDAFDSVLKNDHSKKIFFILHTMGSHFDYSKRYPPEFNVFRPSGNGEPINAMNPDNKEIMVNSYDNSILYTDMILDSLISLIKQENAVSYLMYLSDHGENLYDDSRMRFLHPPSEPTKYVAHIPFFIWTSPDYNSAYPQKTKELHNHLNSPISSGDVFETLLDMANITYPKANLNESISSDKFQNSKQEILGGDMKIYNFKNLH